MVSSSKLRSRAVRFNAQPAAYSRRLVANIADGLMISLIAMAPICLFLLLVMAFPETLAPIDETEVYGSVALSLTIMAMVVWVAAVPFAFWVGFERSRWRATPGKLLLGIEVVGKDGDALTVEESAVKYLFSATPTLILVATAAYLLLDWHAGTMTPAVWSWVEWGANGAALISLVFLILNYSYAVFDYDRRTLIERWLECRVIET